MRGKYMNRVSNLLSESRTAKKDLGKTLNQRDENASFDRCMVGGENCTNPAIRAHCIPETALELLMDKSREVTAQHSKPPNTPFQWLNEGPLKPMTIGKFNASKWTCRKHDDMFCALDTKHFDAFAERNMFLLIYKITVYLCQRVLHAGERLATPLIDPATDTPQELSEATKDYVREVVQAMTYSAARTINMKWEMDKMLIDHLYDKIEYRAAMWQTTPTMAAVGMVSVPGPGDRTEWFGGELIHPCMASTLTTGPWADNRHSVTKGCKGIRTGHP